MLNNIASILGVGGATVGDYESISTVTVGAGGAATVTFSSIPSTYSHLQIRILGRTDRAVSLAGLGMRFNSDTASNYSDHDLKGDGATASAGADVSVSYIFLARYTGSTAAANTFGAGIVDILDYSNTNKYKTTRNLSGADLNGSGQVTLQSGSWRSTSAISSIQLFSDISGNITQYSSFALYGIK